MKMYREPHELKDYLDQPFECDCGKTHYAPLKYVEIHKNALSDLPSMIKKLGRRSPCLVCDEVTDKIAGRRCMEILAAAGVEASLIQLKHLDYDEAAVGELLINAPLKSDIIVAVGTGAINDLVRYFSYKTGRPFMTVATAATMDGFASSIASINVNHFKTTFQARAPVGIIGDEEILKNAPSPMIAAGLGDLLGKCTCLCDWRLSHLVTGEHICDNIVGLMENCVHNVLGLAEKAKDRDPEILGSIMKGLVTAGVAMSLYGNSRPASGCEHHISHFWETIFSQRNQKLVPHGAQVGIGTFLILKAVETLFSIKVDFEAARKDALRYDPKIWEQQMREVYGPAAQGIIQLENSSGKNETGARLRRVNAIEARWEEILDLLHTLPSSDFVAGVLSELHAPYLPFQIGVDRTLLKDTFLYSKETRARYTILQMLWDLDLLDKVADSVVAFCERDQTQQ